MKLDLTPEEKAIYLDLLQELINAETEFEIKKLEEEILSFIFKIKEKRNLEDFDEKAATAQFIRAGKMKLQ